MIGVSNVTAEQLALLVSRATAKPMVVQNRCYAVRGWDEDVRKNLPGGKHHLSRLFFTDGKCT